uniref:Pecanex-like protein n=1 Tax=Macrostomum lignano TaxID=282301 RepID=A0A1I8GLF9_9PLAT
DAGNGGGGGGFSSRSPSPPKKVPEAAAAAAAAAAVAAVAAARPPSLSRSNRGGSLRGSPVLRVLPDRALPSKANSSESLSSASDLSSLTSLVQRKRQESPEPQAPLLPTASVSTTGRIGGRPSGPSGQSQESEDSSESPAEDLQQQQQQQQAAQAPYLGDFSDSQGQSSLCLEFLMLDAQSRTAPQIRQPSARQVKADHQQQQQQQPKADAAPPGAASRPAGLGSSPPKAVSFNLNHEVNTFEKEESTDQRRRRSSHHHQHGKARKEQAADSRISDSGLVDTHAALIDAMLNTRPSEPATSRPLQVVQRLGAGPVVGQAGIGPADFLSGPTGRAARRPSKRDRTACGRRRLSVPVRSDEELHLRGQAVPWRRSLLHGF